MSEKMSAGELDGIRIALGVTLFGDDADMAAIASTRLAVAKILLAHAEALQREADGMREALVQANDLYSNYGLIAGSAACGAWINRVRDLIKHGSPQATVLEDK